MKRRPAVVPALVRAVATTALACLALAGPARAADPAFCTAYAKSAVEQFDAMYAIGCLKAPSGGWHNDYQRHYSWCLTVTQEAADGQRNVRRARIAQCQG